MSGDMLWLSPWRGGGYWNPEARGAAKHLRFTDGPPAKSCLVPKAIGAPVEKL